MVYLPIIGAVMEAAGTIIEKKILKSRIINYKNYTVFEFFAIVIVMLPLLYFTWGVSKRALDTNNIVRFALIIFISILANLFIFYSLKRKKVTEFEPLWLFQPLFTVLLAFFLYSIERQIIIFTLSLIASISLIFSNIKRHHLNFDRWTIAALIGSFLFALELVLTKPLLLHYSPFTFYFIRCFFIFFVTSFMFRPSFSKIGKENLFMIFIVALIWVFYRAIIYYSYGQIGIMLTTLIFILSPVLMAVFAVVFLKEKLTMQQAISTVIILICVVIAIALHN